MLAANRANARKSRGPRTAEGKVRSSMNRFRHGKRSRLCREFLDAFLDDPHFAVQNVDLLFELQHGRRGRAAMMLGHLRERFVDYQGSNTNKNT
jgi:hypothetical protein